MKRLHFLLIFNLSFALLASAAMSARASFDARTGVIADERWQSGAPLGGIGAGKIELLTDGSFGDFTFQGNWDRPYPWAKGAFAAVRVQPAGAKPVVRMLRRGSDGEYDGVTGIAHTKTMALFPRCHIAFDDPGLPVKVSLDAFSPLISHDVKDSCLPVASLSYTVTNASKTPERVTVLLAWPNLLGFGGRSGAEWNDLSGDYQQKSSRGLLSGLTYATRQVYDGERENAIGSDFVGVRRDPGVDVSRCSSWDAQASRPCFWDAFVKGRPLVEQSTCAGPAGAVAATVALAPGQSRVLRFYVSWAMPHLVMIHSGRVYSSEILRSDVVLPARDNPEQNRWSTNRPMRAGDCLAVDMGAVYSPETLSLNSGAAGTDYPRGLKVEGSIDGRRWFFAGEASADQMAGARSSLKLTGAKARYLRLTNLGDDSGLFWSIYGLSATVKEQMEPVYPATGWSLLPLETRFVKREDTGRYWMNWWSDAIGMAAYVDASRDRLLAGTLAWQSPVLKSDLPFWLKLKLINCAFPMFANTVLTRNGRFSVLESPIDMGGALGTMDQRMAAHAYLTAFFPELDRIELEQYAACQQADGRITHFDGNVHEAIVDPNVGYGITDWPDLSCGWVSQVVNLYRWTGDAGFLKRMRPHIDRAMAWLKSDGDGDDGIPAGGSTYDYERLPRGAFIYSASCYLAALQADRSISQAAQRKACDEQLAAVRRSVMKNLWTGRYFRKWKQPATGAVVDDSFIANMAGDFEDRLSGLPRILPAAIVHESVAQTIARHQKPFYPMPPMQVSAAGRVATSACYSLQDEPYLGCEAIYDNYVDDGIETLNRVFFCVWTENKSPWDESLCYDAPGGRKGGLTTYMTSPTSWFVLYALSGASLDLPDRRLYLSPRLMRGTDELHAPLFFPRFWARLDYSRPTGTLTLRIDRVFADAVLSGAGRAPAGASGPMTITSVAADGDSPAIALARPFTVRPGARLDLSSLVRKLKLPAKSEDVDFAVRPRIVRPGVASSGWRMCDSLHDVDAGWALCQDALDGNEATRWTTGRGMRAGDWVMLDMGKTVATTRLVLDSAKSPGDYPRGYVAEGSVDGRVWTRLASATRVEADRAVQAGVTSIAYPRTQCRYIRVTNEGNDDLWWSIYEINAYND